ncbi:MAG: alcohol dehydrogenase catalytic domain-containing protein [Planctomycetota bacterium]|jgi:threonine dehydrogenase-like Zn-dependent dehydrogenase
MTSKLENFKKADAALPEKYLSWDLFGKGIENLGKDKKPVEVDLREPADDEVLLRVDAIGLCFSDTKLIWAGNEHPRIRGRDLVADPTVPGHEASLTVVAAGSQYKDKFKIGDRFLIQADIYINGEQKAFGYVQRGALAQYVYAGKYILEGDDGCYLLPLQDKTGYSEAALVEPWTCVEAAYSIPQRTEPKAGGSLLIVSTDDSAKIDFAGCYKDGAPASVAIGAKEIAADAVKDSAGDGFDDIVVVGKADTALAEVCDAALAQYGIMCMIGDMPSAKIDIGRVHYKDTRHVGAKEGSVADIYSNNTRQDFKAGGAAWMIGAAGPMGQMHVQRSLEVENAPAKVMCTDVSDERLDYMKERLEPIAAKNNIELVCLNPLTCDNFEEQVAAFAPDGVYDDIVVMAPVAPLVEQSAKFMAKDCVMNIFAGVPLGTMADVPLSEFCDKQVRIIGSSGSSMDDIKDALNKTESGRLQTIKSCAGIGDIYQAWEGIKAVKEGTYPGKIVIYPHLKDIPLQAPEALADSCKDAVDAMDGSFWSNEAEEKLFEDRLEN